MMRWITPGAIAVTLGALLTLLVDEGVPRLARSAAPRFGSVEHESTPAGRSTAQRGKRRTRKADVVQPVEVEEPARRVGDTDPAELAQAGTWRKTLQHYARWGAVDEQVPVATAHLRKALVLAENPVARQNVIFLAAHTLPTEEARSILVPLYETGSAGDIEDVVCALAAARDPLTFEKFASLAQSPAPAAVAQLVDSLFEVELLASAANEEARAILRSYRMFELLEGTNYFRLADAGLDVGLPWRSSAHWRRHGIDLLKLWLARYPGHPGSDEVAIRIAERYGRRGEEIESARWYDRAACLPDQRCTSKALRLLLHVAERQLPLERLDPLLGRDLRNPILLHYVAIRRTAAEESCAAGLARLREFAERNPGNELAEAWRRRDAELPWAFAGGPQRLGSVHDRIAGDRTDHDRLFPPREAMPLSVAALARQFGLWERVAELEREIVDAQGENAASSLLALGTLTLSEPELFFPVYAQHTFESGEFLGISRRRSESRWNPWMRRTVHAIRAIEVFRALERAHPEFPRVDEVRRSIESARVELARFEPLDPRPRARAGE